MPKKDKGRKDFIREVRAIVRKHDVSTFSQFYDKCDYQDYCALVEAGPGYQEIIKSALSIEKKYKLQAQYRDRLKWAISRASQTPDPEALKEIDAILRYNSVDVEKFCKDIHDLLRLKHPKINCLRLWGTPNSGKTLLANCISEPFVVCYMNNHGAENEFFISNMLNKSLILCEELYITVATAEDFKSVLGGQPLDIAKKYEEKQVLQRTPVVVTSNYEKFGRGHLSSVDERALALRCFDYHFTQEYHPKTRITSGDFWAWYKDKERDFVF